MTVKLSLIILSGLMLLLTGLQLPRLLHRRDHSKPLLQPCRLMKLRLPRGWKRLMRRCMACHQDTPAARAFHDAGRSMMASLLQIRQQLQALSPLPVDTDGSPRLVSALSGLPDSALCAADLRAMAASAECRRLNSLELAALPQGASIVLCQRLCRILRQLLNDDRERLQALRTAKRMRKHKRPLRLLDRRHVTLVFADALAGALADLGQDALVSGFEEWLEQRGLSQNEAALRAAARQSAMAAQMAALEASFRYLVHADVSEATESADRLHEVLSQDPAGIYPDMTTMTRLKYRQQVIMLSQCLHIPVMKIAGAVLSLSGSSAGTDPEYHIGYWLFEHDGMSALRKCLGARRGWLSLLMTRHRLLLMRIGLWGFSLCAAYSFVYLGLPMVLIPCFLVLAGVFPRSIMKSFLRQDTTLPSMTPSGISDEVRTLVVVPCVLRDPGDAHAMLKRLAVISHAVNRPGVEYLLLADDAPHLTQQSSGDLPIQHTVLTGLEELQDSNPRCTYHYMQRGRIPQKSKQLCMPIGGSLSAITSLCRLIAQGECDDVYSVSTLQGADLYRRFDYVCVVPPDAEPAPGMLDALLAAAAHPLNTRMPSPDGWKGYSIFTPDMICGNRADSGHHIALIQPAAFLEAIDGVIDPAKHADQETIIREITGTAVVSDARAVPNPAQPGKPFPLHRIEQFGMALTSLMWQLPWVLTPQGVIHNPLDATSRFRLREHLRRLMLPICRFSLLLLAAFEHSWILLAMCLFMPSMCSSGLRRQLRASMRRIQMLPADAAFSLWAAVSSTANILFHRMPPPPDERRLLLATKWIQGIAAALMLLTAALNTPFGAPAAVLAALWSSAIWDDAHVARHTTMHAPPNDANQALLIDYAASAWCFMQRVMRAPEQTLPPSQVQQLPVRRASSTTSPEAIAGYLLGCISAMSLELITAAEAAQRICSAADALERLEMPLGVPCRQYALSDGSILDATCDAGSCGMLACALLTCAQAFRERLGELPAMLLDTPERLDRIAQRIELERFLEPDTRLLWRSLDGDGQGSEPVRFRWDEALLLSVAGCALGKLPHEHLMQLTVMNAGSGLHRFPLSGHGNTGAYLPTGLFLPLDDEAARCVAALNRQHGRHGVFGTDRCASLRYDERLQHKSTLFGLPEAAVSRTDPSPVYAPHAAALCLLVAPETACDSLRAMQQAGMLTPSGIADAIDFSAGNPGTIITTCDVYHHGLILCACAHVLADAPIRRWFTSLPQVAAVLPALIPASEPLTLRLPPPPVLHHAAFSEPMTRAAVTDCTPLDAHMIGNKEVHVIWAANGSSKIVIGDDPITHFSGQAGTIEGIQIYIRDDSGMVYRMADPSYPCEMTYCSGSIRTVQRFGHLRCTMTILTDPIQGSVRHQLEVVNLSTTHTTVETADLLIPDLRALQGTLEANLAARDHLTLTDRSSGVTLHHTVSTSGPLRALSCCTDASGFIGRSGSIEHPASLNEPPDDLHHEPSLTPCLSFRASFDLPGRGRISLTFSTCLGDAPSIHFADSGASEQLSAIQARAIRETLRMSREQEASASMMAGAVFWHGQPHQGSLTPPDHTISQLAELGISPSDPLILCNLDTAEGLVLFRNTLAAVGWYILHGEAVHLCVLCPPDLCDACECALGETMLPAYNGAVSIVSNAAAELHDLLEASARLCLHECFGSLEDQLLAIRTMLSTAPPMVSVHPGQLPDMNLIQESGYGGFDPESGDYVIRLEPGMTTPAPWTMQHVSRLFRFSVDEAGIRAPFHERIVITMDNNVLIDPFDVRLPRVIRHGAGYTEWRTYTDVADIRIRVCCMPGHPFGLRAVRIVNRTEAPMKATVYISASLSEHPFSVLQAAPGSITATMPDEPRGACLAGAGEGWEARRLSAMTCNTHQGRLIPTAPDEPKGRMAVLSHASDIHPHRDAQAVWIAGYAGTSDQVIGALKALETSGVSETIRNVRQSWAGRLSALTISTPEETLDLLINRILPMQILSAGASSPDLVAALAITSPALARSCLLESACHTMTMEKQMLLILAVARYIQLTGDRGILQHTLPFDRTLADRCRSLLLDLPLDRQDLPCHCSAADMMLTAYAAKSYAELTDDGESLILARKLSRSIDAHLWQETHYGHPMTLAAQCWSAQVFGYTLRSKQAVTSAWTQLYDQTHGLLRDRMPDDSPPLPGSPGNGAQDTRHAVWMMNALLRLQQTETAWELLRALNPIHHTDQLMRTEEFCGAPYLLPAAVLGAPLQAGRAVPGTDAAAAAWLYDTVLEQMLGFVRRGNTIRLRPQTPPDWDSFGFTLQHGASTWHIHLSRDLEQPTLDGNPFDGTSFELIDDGRVHHVRQPLP